jgi:hypothetical protein
VVRPVRADNEGGCVVCWPRIAAGSIRSPGEATLQTARPRDIGALILVVGVFLILFVVTLTLGTPLR